MTFLMPPPQPETDQAFLDSMELKSSYWYMQASPAQQKRVSDMLVSFRDTFTDDQQKAHGPARWFPS